jgi:methylated-DNA-[protein]-cysteine S-methyltransferase
MSSIYTAFDSPVGTITLVAEGGALTGLYMTDHRHWPGIEAEAARDDAAFAPVRAQLEEYFAGERTVFDLELDLAGTPFQRRVWRALQDIPYGETISYGELARRIGNPSAVRAVGLANGRNPVSIVVPCHRVIGSDGSLTGYGGGLPRKRYLLELEQGTTLFESPPVLAAGGV